MRQGCYDAAMLPLGNILLKVTTWRLEKWRAAADPLSSPTKDDLSEYDLVLTPGPPLWNSGTAEGDDRDVVACCSDYAQIE